MRHKKKQRKYPAQGYRLTKAGILAFSLATSTDSTPPAIDVKGQQSNAMRRSRRESCQIWEGGPQILDGIATQFLNSPRYAPFFFSLSLSLDFLRYFYRERRWRCRQKRVSSAVENRRIRF